jgi:hypothetical protein
MDVEPESGEEREAFEAFQRDAIALACRSCMERFKSRFSRPPTRGQARYNTRGDVRWSVETLADALESLRDAFGNFASMANDRDVREVIPDRSKLPAFADFQRRSEVARAAINRVGRPVCYVQPGLHPAEPPSFVVFVLGDNMMKGAEDTYDWQVAEVARLSDLVSAYDYKSDGSPFE